MAGRGDFAECNAQLLNGRIYEDALTMGYEGGTTAVAYNTLRTLFGAGYWVRRKGTLNLSKFTVLDPDLSVVPGDEDRPTDAIPTSAPLVIEVSDATLAFDRIKKGPAYAKAGIADYWILNVPDRELEVYRDPGVVGLSERGPVYGYGSTIVLDEEQVVRALFRPDVAIPVGRLFAQFPKCGAE